VSSHPDVLPMLMGDQNEQFSINSDGSSDDFVEPTKGYVAAFATGGDTSKLTTTPIIHVLVRQTGYKDVMRVDDKAAKDHQKVKLIILCLTDGDNNEIHARMATHIADAGWALVEGDLIELDFFH